MKTNKSQKNEQRKGNYSLLTCHNQKEHTTYKFSCLGRLNDLMKPTNTP